MKRSLSLALFLLAATPATAQDSDITLSTTPAHPSDAKPNDPVVPDAYVTTGQFDRVVVVRVKHRADLLAGIQQAVKQEKIANAVILSGIGSLRGYHIHTIANRDFPTKNLFIRRPNSPADLVGMNGYVVNGAVHAHMALGAGDKAINGHLEPGTEVFTYAIVTLGVLKGVDLNKVDDKTWR